MIAHLFSPITAWLGLGGLIIVGAGVVAFLLPRFLYAAIIVIAIAAAGMFVFGKGAFYERKVQNKIVEHTADKALKEEQKAADDAQRSVRTVPVSKPRGVRGKDPYARD